MVVNRFLQRREALVDRFLQGVQTHFVGIGELDQLLCEAVDLVVLHRGDVGHLRAEGLAELRYVLRNFLPVRLGAVVNGGAQFALDALVGVVDAVEPFGGFFQQTIGL